MKIVWLTFAVVFVANQVFGTFVITTPRRWPSEGLAQVCVSLLDDAVLDPNVDQWHITLKDATNIRRPAFSSNQESMPSDSKISETNPKEILPKTQLSLPTGRKNACRDIRRPKLKTTKMTVLLEGQFAGTNFSEEVNVTVGQRIFRTFIQPDKSIYKPGQKVQFRLLTIKENIAPFISSSTSGIWKEPYEVVYIQSPNRLRVAQWRNVSNDGLVHLSMDLHDESEQGYYTITVDHGLKTSFSASFEVKQFTLPRFEVTISSPQTIYGNSSQIQLNLCAKYTFGQNVNGNGSLSVSVGSYSRKYANITKHSMINGCESFIFSTEKLRFDDNNCHIRISSITVEGKVVEEGTNNEIHAESQTILINRRVISFTDLSKVSTRKNYLPIQLTVKASFPDSTPAANEKIETCTYLEGQNVCRNFTTDKIGRLEVLLPSEHNNGVQFKAVNYPPLERNFNFVMEESNRYVSGRSDKKFTKAHNASVSIYYFGKLICEDGKNITVNLPIIYVTDGQNTADIRVQIMSNGYVHHIHNETIQLDNTRMPFNYEQFLIPVKPLPKDVIRGMANISFTLPPTVSPEATIIVWFKTTNNSVVADSIKLEVTPCLGNKVEFSFSINETGPGMPAQMTVKAEKNSLCSIGVVDKSVELLGAPDKFSVNSLFDAINIHSPKRWDENQLNLKYCLKKYKNEKAEQEIAKHSISLPSLYRTSVPYREEIEAIQVFKDAGYHVFSPLNLEKDTCDSLLNKVLKSLSNQKSSHNYKRPPVAHSAFSSAVHFDAPQAIAQAAPPAARPQTLTISNKEGTVTEEVTQERIFFPETWLWDLKLLHSDTLTETVTLPDTITEWIGSAVCIGRETGVGISEEASITTFTPFFVELNLPPTVKRGEEFPVIISIFSYSKSPLSVNLQLEKSADFDFVNTGELPEEGSRMFCLDKLQKFVRTIVIKPKKIGDLNITVEALSNRAIANCFDPNAPLKSDRIVKPVLVEAEGVIRERVWSKYACPEDSVKNDDKWNVIVPTDIVMGSERAWINVIGDLLGPSIKNLGSLVNLPYGCGEQNLITFLPNVFILEYLDASNQVLPELEQKLKFYMNLGYQRQLKFSRSDGSFSTFGEIDDAGSTWLTAFVIKGFSRASSFINVDKNIIKRSINFLKRQQAPDGCFYEKGKIINKAIVGEGPIAESSQLTAYVVSALVESNLNNTEKSIITEALPCILKDSSTHPYKLALKAYSLALAGSPEGRNVIKQLLVLAVNDRNELKWILPNNEKNSALSIETASYILLAILNTDPKVNIDNSRKIVRWLSSQRNGRGGFVSTQDTVVALQALSLFERLHPSKAVNVTVGAANSQLDHSFQVTESNKLVEQREDVPSPPNDVNLTATGTGCVLIQGVLRYNVLSKSSDEFFSVNVSSVVDSTCEYHTITTCVSYLLSDLTTNMANIEVNLVTGYSAVEEDLREVVLNVPFKRYEIEPRKIVLYLDEIATKSVCASFRVKQDLIIGNTQPGVIKVYDYYQPEISTERTYDLASCKTSYTVCIDPLTQRPVDTLNANNDLCS